MASSSDSLLEKFDTFGVAFFGTYHQQVETNRQFYDLAYKSKVLPGAANERGMEVVIPPTARQAVDEAVTHILTFPRIKVPVRPTDSNELTEQQIAESKRKFLNAWWRQVHNSFNVIGDGRQPLVNEGKVAIKKTLRWDLLPDKNAKNYRSQLDKLGRLAFMWNVELLDNTTVYEDPSDHRNPKYVYIKYEVLVEQAKSMFPKATGDWTRLGDYEKVRYLEYWSAPTFHSDGSWDPGEYWQWIEREPVHNGDNPYPYIPIAIEDGGFGRNHMNVKVEEKFRGLTEATHSIFIAEARQMTSMEAVAELTAFAPVLRRNGDTAVPLNVEPGAIWDLEGGNPAVDATAETIEVLTWPDIPRTVVMVLDKTTDIANNTLKLNTLGGIPQRGVETATESSQNVRNASAILANPVSALERLINKMSRWVLMDVELVLEAPITVFGSGADDPAEVRLTPRDISGYYDVFVELRTTDQDDVAMTKARFWAEMYRVVPFLSAWTAMERGDIADDPMSEMVRRASEDVFLSPEFAMIRTMTGAQSFGELATLLQGMAGGGTPPNAGSDQSLITQNEIAQPTQALTTNSAYSQRDVNQLGAAYRA